MERTKNSRSQSIHELLNFYFRFGHVISIWCNFLFWFSEVYAVDVEFFFTAFCMLFSCSSSLVYSNRVARCRARSIDAFFLCSPHKFAAQYCIIRYGLCIFIQWWTYTHFQCQQFCTCSDLDLPHHHPQIIPRPPSASTPIFHFWSMLHFLPATVSFLYKHVRI